MIEISNILEWMTYNIFIGLLFLFVAIISIIFVLCIEYIFKQLVNILGTTKLLGKALWLVIISHHLGAADHKFDAYTNQYGTWEIKRIKGPKTK